MVEKRKRKPKKKPKTIVHIERTFGKEQTFEDIIYKIVSEKIQN